MKKWFRFFFTGFFSDRVAREGAKRGYTNFFIGLLLAFVFLFGAYVASDVLPLMARCDDSPDFSSVVHTLFADPDLRIDAEVKDGTLLAKKQGGEYGEALLVNTFESESDRLNYSVNGYNAVVDMRPADTLAEVVAYAVSNDGQNLTVSYEEYLSLSAVARMNFDFKLRYTGRELELDGELIGQCRAYVDSLGDEARLEGERLAKELSENIITKSEYDRAIYELYFVNYYPSITEYESTSKVPLLRNYYYHNYISQGAEKYLFIFDDYIAASFETANGRDVAFYGFYGNIDDGPIVPTEAEEAQARAMADGFIKSAVRSVLPLTLYAHAMNVFTLIPFIALMPLVVTLLAYSILKLGGIESITSFGAAFRIFGTFVWASGAIAAVLTLPLAFLLDTNAVSVLPLLLFFVALAVRAIVFATRDIKLYLKQSEQDEKASTEA